MANIQLRKNSKGLTYRLFANFFDETKQEYIRKSKTWIAPAGMSEEEAERKANALAFEFEEEVKRSCNYGLDLKDYTVEQYSKIYLENIKKNTSISNYTRLYDIFANRVIPMVGKIKLKKLTPFIIQDYFDKCDEMKKEVVIVVAKDNFREVLKKNGFSYNNLRHEFNIQHSSLTNALGGKHVSEEWAMTLAETTGIKFNDLFIKEVSEEEYSYYTIKKWKTALRQLLSYAKKQRVIEENYATVDFVNYSSCGNRADIDAMNDKEAKLYFKTVMECDDIRIKTSLLIFLLTGFRRGEVTGLQWSDVDFNEGTIKVSRAILNIHGEGIVIKDPKTKRSARRITMPHILKEQLLEYKKWQDKEYEMLGWVNTEGWLFTRNNGEIIYPETFAFWHGKILEKAGLPSYKLHSLRHTNITLQIAAGVPLVTVSGRAGHSRTSTTTDIYSHFLTTSDSCAAEAIDNIFDEKSKPKVKGTNKTGKKAINLVASIKELKRYGINSLDDLKQFKEFGLETIEDIKVFLQMQG